MKQHDADKYLKKAKIRPILPENPNGQYEHFAVMPAMDELEGIAGTLDSLFAALPQNAAVLVVVNHPPEASGAVKCADRQLLQLLEVLRRSQVRLYWIDAASPGCEISGGVGEARRIGMDSALAQIPWEKWGNAVIFSVDADAPAAPEYGAEVLRALQENPRCGAVAVGVRHRADDPAEEEAIRRYEQYLYDYRNRLRAAGSPYGFLTIGSAFAVRAETYAACGGMRIKAGGEDFYFLQAVRKIAGVCSVDKALIFPAGRPSGRVPFGTGPSVRSLMQGGSLPEYSDRGFAALQKLLETATEERLSQPEVFRDALFPAALTYLEQNGFFPLWEKVRRNTPKRPGALRHAFDCWFDGLRTLQFLKFAGVPEAEKNPAESDPVI